MTDQSEMSRSGVLATGAAAGKKIDHLAIRGPDWMKNGKLELLDFRKPAALPWVPHRGAAGFPRISNTSRGT
jgi:hypothetical protein